MKILPASSLAAALDCVDTFYEIVFRGWPTAVTQAMEGYTLSYSGDTRLTGANHLWPDVPEALTKSALGTASAFFAQYQAAWSVIFTEPYMSSANDILLAHGFYRRWSSPLMLLDGAPTPTAINRLAQPVRAETTRHLRDIAHVMSEAFLTDNATNQRIARPDLLHHPDITHYLIYEGDDPATCATVARCGSMAGIWNVGTCPRFRHKRYATTIMLALLDDLRASGCTTTILMASPSGQPLYDRLGYQHVGTTFYMGPPRRSY